MKIKITTLIENMPDNEKRLAFEHGFSVYIECEGKKILFDTGQTGDFVKNAEVLGIALEETDAVVLSHGHYDHTGGVFALLELLGKSRKIPCYVGKEFFLEKYKLLEDGSFKYNGNPFQKALLEQEKSPVELNFVEQDVTWLTKNIVLLKNFQRVTEYEQVNPKFFVKQGERYIQDYFPDEIALGLITEQGVVLIAGCSHVGIVNMLEHVKRILQLPVMAVLGGTHLVEAGEERLEKTVEALREYGVQQIAVSHCTGEAGMELLKREFPKEFTVNNTGNVMLLEMQ